jgi:hypothetical protein
MGYAIKMDVADLSCMEWSKPVYVRIGYGSSEPISGPSQALYYLEQRWPSDEGPYHSLVVTKCTACLHRHVPAEEVRDLFISAAIEAYVLA